MEIDRAKSEEHLVDAAASRQISGESPGKTFIPGVEACHIGPVPLTAVVGALLVARDDRELFKECDEFPGEIFQCIEAFDCGLPPPPQDDDVEALWAGRRRFAQGRIATHDRPGRRRDG